MIATNGLPTHRSVTDQSLARLSRTRQTVDTAVGLRIRCRLDTKMSLLKSTRHADQTQSDPRRWNLREQSCATSGEAVCDPKTRITCLVNADAHHPSA